MNLVDLLNNKVYSSPLSELKLEKKSIICTINPHSYCLAKKDKIFERALIECDILLPDGIGIVWAKRFLLRKKIIKIAGADVHQVLLEKANIEHEKVFYLGASVNTLELIKNKISIEYPSIKVDYYSPPFKNSFSNIDNEEMIGRIREFKPDILFVGMTAPKQEKWVLDNQHYINVRVIASIGAVFDFYAGTVKRSGPIWIKLGLEWLPRLMREPKRLWRRNLISTPLFIIELIKEKLNIRIDNDNS